LPLQHVQTHERSQRLGDAGWICAKHGPARLLLDSEEPATGQRPQRLGHAPHSKADLWIGCQPQLGQLLQRSIALRQPGEGAMYVPVIASVCTGRTPERHHGSKEF
jgi:hypothetical protein